MKVYEINRKIERLTGEVQTLYNLLVMVEGEDFRLIEDKIRQKEKELYEAIETKIDLEREVDNDEEEI